MRFVCLGNRWKGCTGSCYHIFKRYWALGYAPEAARLFINFAFENELTDSIISIIHVNNLRSQRLAEKNDLVCEKQANWLDFWMFIFLESIRKIGKFNL